MRSRSFYPRLAMRNLSKNRKFCLPYILTGMGMAAMMYVMCFVTYNSELRNVKGADELGLILNLGCIVIAIFAVIFMIYSNSFLMKRRKKELGLYNILGMEKRHIARVLCFETFIYAALSIVGGVLVGILFSKLVLLLLLKIMNVPATLRFFISWKGIAVTAIILGVIFCFTLLLNLNTVRRAKPVDLLKGGDTGEREPKAKWLVALLGVIALGAGYWMAITVESPIDALMLFFVAVILVIIGTYLLFIAGSIAVLKLLRRNKKYYYRTKHFTSVSGMLYRMKQNAAGLAGICILCTMVLVMVSTTLSLYIGLDDAIGSRYPTDLAITLQDPSEGQTQVLYNKVLAAVSEQGRTIKSISDCEYLSTGAVETGAGFTLDSAALGSANDVADLVFVTEAEYDRITGAKPALADGEALVYTAKGETFGSFELMGKQFSVKEQLKSFPFKGEFVSDLTDVYYIVLTGADYEALDAYQREAFGSSYSVPMYTVRLDIDGTDAEKIACHEAIIDSSVNWGSENGDMGGISYPLCRSEAVSQYYILYGGFLFLGVFLGVLFLMAMVLIIYYKQVSEGYDDAERFKIMQKVGMSRAEVRSTVRSQVLTVFFLPLITAGIHVAAAFKMITKLLAALGLTNIPLFAWCTLGTVIVFAVIYAAVYALTAKAYYKIVS